MQDIECGVLERRRSAYRQQRMKRCHCASTIEEMTLAALARDHLEALCVTIGERPVGSLANLAAADYVAATFHDLGLVTRSQAFECLAWRDGGARTHRERRHGRLRPDPQPSARRREPPLPPPHPRPRERARGHRRAPTQRRKAPPGARVARGRAVVLLPPARRRPRLQHALVARGRRQRRRQALPGRPGEPEPLQRHAPGRHLPRSSARVARYDVAVRYARATARADAVGL